MVSLKLLPHWSCVGTEESFSSDLKHLLDGLSEAVEVVLDQPLSLKHVLPQQTYQRQKPEQEGGGGINNVEHKKQYMSWFTTPH